MNKSYVTEINGSFYFHIHIYLFPYVCLYIGGFSKFQSHIGWGCKLLFFQVILIFFIDYIALDEALNTPGKQSIFKSH